MKCRLHLITFFRYRMISYYIWFKSYASSMNNAFIFLNLLLLK